MEFTTEITQFADAISSRAVGVVTALAAIGVVSMAIIQTVKDLFPVRRLFQESFLRGWLHERRRESQLAPKPDDARAGQDLVRLATSGSSAAFYDLPIEQLAGQMNAAAALVLEFPARHRDLLGCLASIAEPDDLRVLVERANQTRADLERLQQQAPGDYQALVDARTRVMHQVQRSIDGFQIAAGYRWKLYMQLAAFTISYVLTVLGVTINRPAGTPAFGGLVAALPLGILGGFLAPVARDLVVAWTQPRRP
ncbi:MAG: hypothetical protein HYX76_04065 [Acidobacteria bacterium]|nr:hypothetical protein [Acidobacteriota bacterium]